MILLQRRTQNLKKKSCLTQNLQWEGFGLTIGTRRWLNFLVASDFERGLKLSKRLVLRVGVVGESRPSSVWSSELPAPAAWGPHGRLFFLLTLKLTEPMVAVRGLIAEL